MFLKNKTIELFGSYGKNMAQSDNPNKIRLRKIIVAALLVTGISYAAEEPLHSTGKNPTERHAEVAFSDAMSILTRVDAWQQAHRAAVEARPIDEARWIQGVYAAYRVSAQTTLFERCREWVAPNSVTLPKGTDPVKSLMAALPIVRLQAITSDSTRTTTPAGWMAWWKDLSQRSERSPRMIGALATVAAMGAITPTHKMEARLAWFQALNQQMELILPSLVEPQTGLLRSESGSKLADQGEALLGLVSILDDYPPTEVAWARWAGITRRLATSLIERQGADGLWSADMATSKGDLVGTALLVAGLATAVDQGLVDSALAGPALQRAWTAIAAGVAADGSLRGRTQTANDSGAVMLAAASMIRLQRLLSVDGRPLAASDSALLPSCALSVHPLADQITRLVDRATVTPVEATGLTKANYLRSIAHLVAYFRQHQAADGRIIDPLKKVEFHYATPLYAHAAAILIVSNHDRSPELLDSAMRALDVTTADLAATATMKPRKIAPGSDTNTSDFYIRPVMGAYHALKGIAATERFSIWTTRLSGLDPKTAYSMTDGNFTNWSLCLLWGEFQRNRLGWQPDSAIDHTMNIQRWHATPLGLYFEGHGPWAYDVFGRYFVVGMLADGYRGSEFDFWRDSSWRGAWTSLLVQAPNGEIPIGGRSAQHIWNEPQAAAIWERYASAYAKAGRPVEAGMFKRAAHLALRETQRWLNADGSNQVTKNFYPCAARHGYMPYSYVASYSLLAASMLASAWEAANEGIAERAAPADLGGVFVQSPEFASVIAHAGGAYINYFTNGDQHYDATGLARVQLRDVHPQLGPSASMIGSDHSDSYKSKLRTPWSIGPIWSVSDNQQIRLASLQTPGVRVMHEQVSPDRASFTALAEMPSKSGVHRVTQTLTLVDGTVQVRDQWNSPVPGTMAVSYPVLTTDGRTTTNITITGQKLALQRPDAGGLLVEITSPLDASIRRTGKAIKHPNGMAEPFLLQGSGNFINYTISKAK